MPQPPYTRLIVWKKSVELSRVIRRVSAKFRNDDDYFFAGELRQSISAVIANIMAATTLDKPSERLQRLSVACGKIQRLRSVSVSIRDLEISSSQSMAAVEARADEVARMLFALRRRFRGGAPRARTEGMPSASTRSRTSRRSTARR